MVYPARSVSGLPSVFVVGARQVTTSVPPALAVPPSRLSEVGVRAHEAITVNAHSQIAGVATCCGMTLNLGCEALFNLRLKDRGTFGAWPLLSRFVCCTGR